MPHGVAIFCKSFDEDFSRLAELLASRDQFCPDTPFVLSIPRAHHTSLRRNVPLGSKVEVVFDEDYADVERVGSYGWYRQQVCKLSIHRTGLADAYISIDSDAYFLQSLDPSDFFEIAKMRVVYSSLFTKYELGNDTLLRYILDPEMAAPAAPAAGSLDGFAGRLRLFLEWITQSGDVQPIERLRWINKLFQVPGNTSLQPGQILHASLLAGMESFFAELSLSMADLINLIPWEYNWYGSWAVAAERDRVACSVSPIIHFASEEAVAHAKAAGITPEKIKRRFKIVQMAARHFDAISF